jgi:protein-disulfide isomerase
MMNRRSLLLASAALTLSTSISGIPAFAQEAAPAEEAAGVFEMVLGNPDSKVEVIEYASFTCPHCAAFAENQFVSLKANYIDTGLIKFVYRDVYFDRFGLWAGMIARCGNNTERFFGLTEMLYQQQRDWLAGGDPATIAANLKKMGKVAGLDDAALDACTTDAGYAQGLVDWYTENAERDEITSTPSFLINGVKYTNMAYEEFAAILDAELAK